MAQAEVKEVLSVSKDQLLKTITDYENYPKFVENVTKIRIDKREGNTARVTYDHARGRRACTY